MIEHKNYRYEDIRNFYFENEKGQRIDCQKVGGRLFLYNVTGLGFEKNVEYVQVGNTFVKNEEKVKQNVIDGELEFYELTYEEYLDFVNFILKSESLKLVYIPKLTNRIEFYREIDFVKIDKNEEDDFNILVSPIQIYCLSLWYKKNIINYSIEEIDNEIRWDFEWDSRFNEYDSRSLTFINEGHTEAPIEVEIKGHVLNPKIELYVEGQLYQTVTFNVDISQYEKLLYGTKENNFYINRRNADGTESSLFSLDVIDFANDNVIRLPQNKSCEIKISADNDVAEAKITILTYYKAV